MTPQWTELLYWRDRIGGLRQSTWENQKKDFLEQMDASKNVDQILALADKNTTTDARIRILCRRTQRKRALENPEFGAF
jgi:hypothetical protein